MPPAILIARLVGPVFATLGIGILCNLTLYTDMVGQATTIPTLVYLFGAMSLAAGIAILHGHHAWTADWRVVVTIIGWLLVIGGVLRIVLPRLIANVATTVYSGPGAMAVAGVIVLIIGGYLSFEGYRRHSA